MARTYTNEDVFHPTLCAQAKAAGFPIRACVAVSIGKRGGIEYFNYPTKNFKDKRSAWDWIKQTGRHLNGGKGVSAEDMGKRFWVLCD